MSNNIPDYRQECIKIIESMPNNYCCWQLLCTIRKLAPTIIAKGTK